jgi:hypothetical protein
MKTTYFLRFTLPSRSRFFEYLSLEDLGRLFPLPNEDIEDPTALLENAEIPSNDKMQEIRIKKELKPNIFFEWKKVKKARTWL